MKLDEGCFAGWWLVGAVNYSTCEPRFGTQGSEEDDAVAEVDGGGAGNTAFDAVVGSWGDGVGEGEGEEREEEIEHAEGDQHFGDDGWQRLGERCKLWIIEI